MVPTTGTHSNVPSIPSALLLQLPLRLPPGLIFHHALPLLPRRLVGFHLLLAPGVELVGAQSAVGFEPAAEGHAGHLDVARCGAGMVSMGEGCDGNGIGDMMQMDLHFELDGEVSVDRRDEVACEA